VVRDVTNAGLSAVIGDEQTPRRSTGKDLLVNREDEPVKISDDMGARPRTGEVDRPFEELPIAIIPELPAFILLLLPYDIPAGAATE